MTKVFYQIRETCEALKKHIQRKVGDVGLIEYVASGYKENDTPPVEGWKEFAKGTRVSGNDGHFWFRMSFKTPHEMPHNKINLIMSTGFEGQCDTLNPQGMVYLNGNLVQAFDTNHTMVELEPDKDYTVHIYFYMGMIDESCEYNLWLTSVDKNIEKLYYDMFTLFQACRDVYIENSTNYANTLRELEKTCNILDLRYPYSDEYYASIDRATEYLKENYFDKYCGNSDVTVNCIGHTHIDVAWLWTLAQTKEKVQRSFSTALELMKHYPEYIFSMSQPQLFKYLSEVDPALYKKVKEKVKEGRWEMEGAMWLEADCNLISGESMVRQILYGKKFLREEFGVESKTLWLPDVFGYSAAMPQILNKFGIENFVTSKISWNDTNTMPNDTFMWKGIDGSEIFTYFITTQDNNKHGDITNETTYVGRINPTQVAGCWNRYQQKEYNNEVMLVYGYGDGGGGPTADMLEQQRRLQLGLPGMPKTKICTISEHLKNAKKNFKESCKEIGRIPKWAGELYLEFHRGTYTSIAKNKRNNRKAEFLMQGLEGIYSILNATSNTNYLQKEFYNMWHTIMLNQFHDIIPGSSIEAVYNDSDLQYAELFKKGQDLYDNALSKLAEGINADKDGILVYNPLGFTRNDIIEYQNKKIETGEIPAFGWKVIIPCEARSLVKIAGLTVENDFFVLTLDKAGRISGLFDKRNEREVFAKDSFGNEIQVFEDMPYQYDNWEISEYYRSKMYVLDEEAEITAIDEGCRKGFEIRKSYHSSTIIQKIYLYNSIERIDVENSIDWHEQRQLVKVAFPLNVLSNNTTYDIQFGNVERNNHQNTSWDEAKFEVCGQKWVDMSEYGYGVSILNDCKYGYSVDENVLKLTVLKCTTWPNPHADQGMHVFKYSIFPHASDFRHAGTVKHAYSINQPLAYMDKKASNCGALPECFSFVSVDKPGIVVDTVKKAEKDNGIIVRMFDCFNTRTKANIKFGIPVSKVALCDLEENIIKELEVNDNSVLVDVGNYEIVTLCITAL